MGAYYKELGLDGVPIVERELLLTSLGIYF